MSDKKLPLSKHEKLLLWVWRNALASGVVLTASYLLWGEIRTIQATQLEINQAIIELNTQDSQVKRCIITSFSRCSKIDLGNLNKKL